MHKVGIGCVFIPPAGTSRKDPLTGMHGFRNYKTDKSKLYVLRDGVLGTLNADFVGALNVLLSGLSHSVVPYRVYGAKKDKEDEEVKEKVDGKRITRFCKIKSYSFKTLIGVNYYTGEGIITHEQKLNREEQIKQLSLSNKDITKFDLIPSNEKTCKSFQIH